MKLNFALKSSGLALAVMAALAIPVYAESEASMEGGSEAGLEGNSYLGVQFFPIPNNPILWGNNQWGQNQLMNPAPIGSSVIPAQKGGTTGIYGVTPSYTGGPNIKNFTPRSNSRMANRHTMM